MKIGILSDIHNNTAALDAVLREFARIGADRVICLGDIIGIGPFPEETARRVMGLHLLACVSGNHEQYLVRGAPGWMQTPEVEYHAWEHARLSAVSRAFLTGLAHDARLAIEGVSIYAVHYPLDGYDFAPIARAEAIELFPRADVCLYGHDHARAITRAGGRLYVNCGALGCPGSDRDVARAGILTVRQGEAEIEHIEVRYDAASMRAAIARLSYPAAEKMLRRYYGHAHLR